MATRDTWLFILVIACGTPPRTNEPLRSVAVETVPSVEAEAIEEAPSAQAVVVEVPAQVGPIVTDGEAVGAWIAERARLAAIGRGELVRIPVVVQSDGWGCSCPQHFVGHDPTYHSGGETFLHLTYADGVSLPEPEVEPMHEDPSVLLSVGLVILVDGYFTSERHESGDQNEHHEWHFHVVRLGELLWDEDAWESHVEVLAADPSSAACRLVAHDDRPPLRVHATAGPLSRVVGELANGAAVTPIEWQRGWTRLAAPAGWVWTESLARHCAG